MTNPCSNSVLLVWRVADLEARGLNATKIAPEHLLLGLCKVVDLNLADLFSRVWRGSDEVLEECLREVRRLRNVFNEVGLNPIVVRRAIRAQYMGKLSSSGCGMLHRNDATKTIFASAQRYGRLAGTGTYPLHLLYALAVRDESVFQVVFNTSNVTRKALRGRIERELLIGDASTRSTSENRWN